MSKLTLYMDDKVVERAKAYAKAHHTSVSKLVTKYLASQNLLGFSPLEATPF
jgi:hypothetical protein